jgi:hypothetical protein
MKLSDEELKNWKDNSDFFHVKSMAAELLQLREQLRIVRDAIKEIDAENEKT